MHEHEVKEERGKEIGSIRRIQGKRRQKTQMGHKRRKLKQNTEGRRMLVE
jgi:hypothetical protein